MYFFVGVCTFHFYLIVAQMVCVRIISITDYADEYSVQYGRNNNRFEFNSTNGGGRL